MDDASLVKTMMKPGCELMLIHCDRVNQHTDSMCKLHEKRVIPVTYLHRQILWRVCLCIAR